MKRSKSRSIKHPGDFPFERARKATPAEVEAARRAIEKLTGKPRSRRGRPPKPAGERYRAISIRLHPKALAWAGREAKRRGVGYQSVINGVLLEAVGRWEDLLDLRAAKAADTGGPGMTLQEAKRKYGV